MAWHIGDNRKWQLFSLGLGLASRCSGVCEGGPGGDSRSILMKVDYKFEGTSVVVTVDGNSDGQPVLSLTLNLAEIPDEILSLITSKKAQA